MDTQASPFWEHWLLQRAVDHRPIKPLCSGSEHVSEGLQPTGSGFRFCFSLCLSSLQQQRVLNVLIEEVVFGYVLGVNRTLNNKFSSHCSPVDDFNQIYKVLFGFEASYEFSVIRRPIIHFHVLPIEEKYGRGNITDVKILCINWSVVHIHQVDGSHFTQVS